MAHLSKRVSEFNKKVELGKLYTAQDAVNLLKEISSVKFDESVEVAINLGIDARPFLVAICFGSSCSFMTPMGYQTNLMVYGPGQYKLKDFFQMGLPITVIFWLCSIVLIPKIWPFVP